MANEDAPNDEAPGEAEEDGAKKEGAARNSVNLSKQTLARVGRLLGGKEKSAPMANLVAWTGIRRKTIYNWTLDPGDPQHRTMPPFAKRLVAVLAYFAVTRQLNEQRLDDIKVLEAAMGDDGNFQKIANRVNRILKQQANPPSLADAAEEGAAAPEESAPAGKGKLANRAKHRADRLLKKPASAASEAGAADKA